jgi:hypothetical protein
MHQVQISPVDAVFSNGSYPIEFLFYYGRAFDTKRLRRALRKLSSIFWPAFAEYRDGVIVFDQYREADCFEEEIVDREWDPRGIDESDYEILSRLALPPLKRLFFLKAVRYKNGLALIPKINHLAGDGYSYFLFLSFLAAFSRPTLVPFKSSLMSMSLQPDHRRTVLREFAFRGVGSRPLPPIENLTIKSDEIPRPDVRAVIREAMVSAGLRISSNDVLSALAMKKLVKAQPGFWGKDVRLTIPIDVRGRVKEYGRGFFGNSIMFHNLTFKKGDLEDSPIQEIAVRIRKSMPSLSKELYVDFLKRLEEIVSAGRWDEFRPYDPTRGCLVTNLSRLPLDRLDFGTGPPERVIPLTIERNGAAILARGENYLLRYAY